MVPRVYDARTYKSTNGGVDNAVATATAAAATGVRQCMVGVLADYDGDVDGGVLTIYDGATIKAEIPVRTHPLLISFPAETPLLRGTKGGAVSAALSASGTVGVKGFVNIVVVPDPHG